MHLISLRNSPVKALLPLSCTMSIEKQTTLQSYTVCPDGNVGEVSARCVPSFGFIPKGYLKGEILIHI